MDKTKFRPIGVENDKADNSVIAPVESGTTASQAYAKGAHFIKNGAFCTAKTAIAQGETFTLNTNYTAGDIADTMPIIDYRVAFGTVEGTEDIPSNGTVSFDIPRISGMNRIFLQQVCYMSPSLFMSTVLAMSTNNFTCRVENKYSNTVSKNNWRIFWMQTT